MLQCLSIAAFSSPYLKPLFEALESGFVRSDDLRCKGIRNEHGLYDLSIMGSTNGKGTAGPLTTISDGFMQAIVTAKRPDIGVDNGSQRS